MSSGTASSIGSRPRSSVRWRRKVESPATQLQAGELASLNYGGGSSRPAPRVVLVWVPAAALSIPAQAAALGWARAGP
jgi:hypothetical protein